MSSEPAPRPALQRPEGSDLPRPVPARLTDLAVELPPPGAHHATHHSGAHSTGGGRGGKDELVTLKVPLPKSVRKELRIRAEQAGYSPEELVYHLVRSWLQR
jgi:hypothetical protein